MQRSSNIWILCLLLIILILAGCSADLNYKILHFVFDGVPEPVEKEIAAINDTSSVQEERIIDSVVTQEKTQLVIHAPYKNRECRSCHDPYNMSELQSKLPDLCYHCHQDFKKKFRSLHGPVEGGYCSACHHPHASKNDKLLLKEGNELCLFCHDAADVDKSVIHNQLSDYTCADCHDPHGGESLSLLKEGTCYRCHEKYENKYAYVHGPVAGGFCTSCHGSHSMNTKAHIIREGQQLCLYCHDFGRIVNREPHGDIGESSCIDCHNPHGGSGKELLY